MLLWNARPPRWWSFQHWLCSQRYARRAWQRQHPLAHRYARDDVLDQVRGNLRPAPCSARGAKPAPLATEPHEFVVAAIGAANAQEALRQHAARQERVKLVLDELR